MKPVAEPPKARTGRATRGRGKWQRVAAKLEGVPGEWHLVAKTATYSKAESAARCLKAAGCDATTRQDEDSIGATGGYLVHARWPVAR
jgi:hypothetical protein